MKVSYLLSALGVAGGAAAATPALAVDVPLNYAVGTSNDITLAGATSPQFYYDSEFDSFSSTDKQFFGAYSPNGVSGPNPTGPLDSQSYSSTSVKTTNTSGPKNVNTIDLSFTVGSQQYYGVANFDSNETLTDISYNAVPEPAAWALLIAGAGLVGGAARSRRRVVQAA